MTLGKTGGTAKPPTAEIDARIGHDTWRWSFLAKIWRKFWQHFPSRNSLKNVGLEFDLERLTLFLVGLEKKASCLFLFFFVRSLFVFFSGCWAGLGWDFQEKNQSYAHRNWTYETGESGGQKERFWYRKPWICFFCSFDIFPKDPNSGAEFKL